MASVCALPKGHQGDHRNVWNSAWSPLGKVAGQPVVLEFTVNAGPGFPTVSRLFGHIDPGSVRTSAQAKATPGWRVGTKQPRNLYRDDIYMGVMFDDRVSREVAETMKDLAAQAQLTEREHRMRLDAADSARRADANAARWSSRYGQLIGDALHMLRRLNALAGQPDAKDFTRAAASAAVNAVLELRKQDAVKITNLEDDLVGASREIGRLDEVLTGLRVQSQCPHLQPQVVSGRFTSQELRRCVRVNQHDGQHIRSDGEAW